MSQPFTNEDDAFWEKVQQAPDSDCMIYTEASEHGTVRFRGRVMRISRAAWISLEGEVPEGMKVARLCSTKGCCRRKHLTLQEDTSQAETHNTSGVLGDTLQSKAPIHIDMSIERQSPIGRLLEAEKEQFGGAVSYQAVIRSLLLRYISMMSNGKQSMPTLVQRREMPVCQPVPIRQEEEAADLGMNAFMDELEKM
jgi:hypothetical protein